MILITINLPSLPSLPSLLMEYIVIVIKYSCKPFNKKFFSFGYDFSNDFYLD